MARIAIKFEELPPFGEIFSIMELFDQMLSTEIDHVLGKRCQYYGYQCSEIIRFLVCVYFCGGTCIEDVTNHLMPHLSLHPSLRTCSADTVLRAITKLSQDNTVYTSDTGNTYAFNTAKDLDRLLVKFLISTGQFKRGESYDLDFDHQYIETEKFDAKRTYKKFSGYGSGVAVIGDMIVGIENRDGNTNVRFHQQDTLQRFFETLENNGISINRFRADYGSCSEKIVRVMKSHCKHFYIRANRFNSLYNDIFALKNWKIENINGIDFELNSILVEKWKEQPYRLVIQRQKRMNSE